MRRPRRPLGADMYNGQNPFVYVKPTEESVYRITVVREACETLAHVIEEEIKDSAEKTLALRKLEECSMWCNKAIVFYQE